MRSDWAAMKPIPQTEEERDHAIQRSIRLAVMYGEEWRCPLGCDFHRHAETKGGVLRVAGKHLRLEHNTRLEVHFHAPS